MSVGGVCNAEDVMQVSLTCHADPGNDTASASCGVDGDYRQRCWDRLVVQHCSRSAGFSCAI